MTTKRLIRISYFTMLTIVGGLIKIPIPGTPLMMTFQTLFVIMSGLMLGAKDGAISQIAYLVLGIAGVPIFTKGGGFWYVFEPSFGYIIGFIGGSFLTGFLKSRFRTLSVNKLFFCCFMGLMLIYLIGIPYQVLILWLYLGNSFIAAAATLASIPLMFVVDAVLLYLICLIYPRLHTIIGLSNGQQLMEKKKPNEGIITAQPKGVIESKTEKIDNKPEGTT